MSQTWFVKRNDEEFGPFADDEMLRRVAIGWLRECDYVRRDRTAPWAPATRLQGVTFAPKLAVEPTIPSSPSTELVAKNSKVIAYDRFFRVVAPLLDPASIQFLILMGEFDLSLPSGPEAAFYHEFSVRSPTSRTAAYGQFKIEELMDKLPDAEIFGPCAKERIALTPLGKDFAIWLTQNGYQAEYFLSPLGSWGEKPFDWPEEYP